QSSSSTTVVSSTRRSSISKDVHASPQREPPSCADSWPTPYPHRLLRLELRELEAGVLGGPAGEPVARALRASLRDGRGEQHFLPAAESRCRRQLGADGAPRLRLRGQGVALSDPCQASARRRRRPAAFLRPHRPAAPQLEA